MKKLTSLFLMLLVAVGFSFPALADDGQEVIKNTKTGARNVTTGWVEVLDSTHAEASKGSNAGEHLTGVVAGGAIGVRRTIHRLGAGAIDLLTFWIPKKEPLVSPETARLE